MGKKVVVGLSGGVDSGVSALLLKQAGYEVIGVHLYCWPPKGEEKPEGCRADEDRKSALKTALELKIPFKILDFSEEYKTRVVDYFYREYEAGRTPNPDVLCNSEIKFGLFLDWALKNGFDYVATGHYARLTEIKTKTDTNNICLCIPCDKHKDQTYFLWKLTQKELKHVLFPLGDYLKKEVREMAKKANLSVADRKDSQGICFVGNVDVQEFLRRRLKEKSGEVVDVKGKVIGAHKGVWFYTIGQRHGFSADGLGGSFKHARPPLYVVEKDAKKNRLVVGFGVETYKDSFVVGEVNWISESGLEVGKVLKVRIRHGRELIPCKLIGDRVELEEPQRGVAAGQSAVFYVSREAKGEVGWECLGGGVIE